MKQANKLRLAATELKHRFLNTYAQSFANASDHAQSALTVWIDRVYIVGQNALDHHATSHGW